MGDDRDDRTGDKLAVGSAGIAPVIVIHSLAHAVAALHAAQQAGQPVTLASAPGAGIYAGPGWFGALIAEACASMPTAAFVALLDCADDPGAVQAAIRAGIAGIIFTGRADIAERLADIAAQAGARLLTARPDPALDLAGEFFAAQETLCRRCAEILASKASFC